MELMQPGSPIASVLVLEEDPFRRAGLRALLAEAGYEPVEAAEGPKPQGRIDLVLAGTGVQPVLRGRDRAPPVILLVDHAVWSCLDFLDAANDLGAAAVLQRPFSRATLLGLMAQVLSQLERAAAPSGAAGRRHPVERLVLLDNPNFG